MNDSTRQPNMEFLRQLSILYVEDEDEVREGLGRFLRRRMGRVDTAANGKEGLDKFREFQPDVVVTDVRMPVMDGLEMAKNIKELSRELPVIVVTAFNETDYFIKAIELGVDRYVKKPVNTDELLAAIEQSAHIRFQQRDLDRARRHEREILEHTIAALSRAIEKRDAYTDGHQKRVAQLAVAIGTEMGLTEEALVGLRLGALIHDVGKLYVPAELLSTPRRLSPQEFELIKTHPQAGFDIVEDVEFPWPISQIISQHHERLDGSGYPFGLKDGAISIEARIVAVADVVESMASHRPYRAALGLAEAMAEIRRHRGTHYDPRVVDTCIGILEQSGTDFWNHPNPI